MNYYNEFDAYAAKHIQNLIDNKIIAHGVVDTRSIEDVRPDDLKGFTQCHFFAGIAGWSYALDLAGWDRNRSVWTGSCPCQPFSAAGEGNGFEDERHLWPAWQHLIAQCNPPEIFGEQVASKAAEPWVDLVQADLEGMGYAFGCVPYPAAGIGAPHIRDRLYWVAHANNARLERWNELDGECSVERTSWACGVVDGMADTSSIGRIGRRTGEASSESRQVERLDGLCDAGLVAYAESSGRREERKDDGRIVAGNGTKGLPAGPVNGRVDRLPGPVNGHWRAADWLGCRDGKWRPVEPGTQPLAHGISGRVGRLRAYGNAIVPQQAAEFVRAYMEARNMTATRTPKEQTK